MLIVVIGILLQSTVWYTEHGFKQHGSRFVLVFIIGEHISMSISVDSPSKKTLNRRPLVLLLRRPYELPCWIDIVQFSIFNFALLMSPLCTEPDYNFFSEKDVRL